MEEVDGGLGQEFPVVADHAQPPLELLDCRRGRRCSDGFDFFGQRGDALFVDHVPEELEAWLTEQALRPLDDHAVCGECLEDVVEIL